MSFHLAIVTPEKTIFSDTVGSVRLPGSDGEMGALEGHAALVTLIDPGELAYEKDGKMVNLAIGSGFVEVTQEEVSVLTDMALGEEEIDEAKTEQAIKRAEEQIASLGHDHDAEEMAHLQSMLAKATAQLNLKRRHRH